MAVSKKNHIGTIVLEDFDKEIKDPIITVLDTQDSKNGKTKDVYCLFFSSSCLIRRKVISIDKSKEIKDKDIEDGIIAYTTLKAKK